MSRKKVAVTWLSGCGGCDESILDMLPDPMRFLEDVDVVYWPLAFNGRLEDLVALPDGDIALSLVNGAVRTQENVRMARLLRRKSQVLVAFGSCAHLGGVYGLANLFPVEEVLARSYGSPNREGKPVGTTNGGPPRLLERVLPLDRVVEVDAVIPGCPPVPARVQEALHMLLHGDPPSGGRVLADERALCESCPRRDTRSPGLELAGLRRIHETEWDEERCFLDQGIVCMGPVTRGGCEARCIRANMPCRGCFGPPEGVSDQGAGAVSFLASLIRGSSMEVLEAAAEGLTDPAGSVYRYSLPSSLSEGAVRRRKRLEP